MSKINTENIIELLCQGDDAVLHKIYVENREPFLKFASKYHVQNSDAADIYQDTILALRQNAINGKIKELNSHISTYIFAIGKYKIYQLFRDRSKLKFTEDLKITENSFELNVNLLDEKLTNQQELIKKCLNKLGKQCQKVLTLFYFQGYVLDEIKNILEYSDKNVLKSQKSRCLKQLKDLIKKEL